MSKEQRQIILLMPGHGQQQLSRWCFTLNNWTEAEIVELTAECEKGEITYLIYGKETCPTTGTPHLQGYLELRTKRRLGGVKQLGGLSRANFRRSNGSAEDNRIYCSKGNQSKEEYDELRDAGQHYGDDAEVFEFGNPKTPGKRSDLNAVKTAIDEGATINDLWQDHFGSMVRYEKSFKRYKGRFQRRDPNEAPRVFVLWGGTGTGKSRFTRLVTPSVFSVPDVKLKWWDGYDGDEVILFDDFDGKDVAIGDFLRYTDRYDVQVAIKGGFEHLMAKTIWITSNSSPDDWFPNELQVKRDAVRRRLTKVVHLQDPINFDNEDEVNHVKILLNLN